ncbi:hypothetical protein SAMN05421505_1044 [Sinosporangium album]|uniref:DUF262 domain-containing protein n=1 Tax=Sinosporangium album TaxID=504805 RepID=A0A1G7TX61_9ACTN|nr:hypothetical protein SAMN05421505_1044 [Sinosporangium album]
MWKRPAPAATVRLGPFAVEAPETPDALWVLDGRQRVISLVGALSASEETVDPRFRIFYNLKEDTFVSIGRREEVPDECLPLTLTLDPAGVSSWTEARFWLTKAELMRVNALIAELHTAPIPMTVIEGPDERRAHQIFDRLTFGGHPDRWRTTRLDVGGAAPGAGAGTGLAALESDVDAFGFGEIPADVLKHSVAAVRFGRPYDAALDTLTGDEWNAAFRRTEHALGIAVDFLRSDADIPHDRVLPGQWVLVPLARFVALFGAPTGRVAELLRRWTWRGFVDGIFSRQESALPVISSIGAAPLTSATRLLSGVRPTVDVRGELDWTVKFPQ